MCFTLNKFLLCATFGMLTVISSGAVSVEKSTDYINISKMNGVGENVVAVEQANNVDGSIVRQSNERAKGEMSNVVEGDKHSFSVSIKSELEMRYGDEYVEVNIRNRKSNVYPVRVELYKDSGEHSLLYRTDVISSGYMIRRVPISVKMPRGLYDCLARFIVLGRDALKEIGNVEIKLRLTVV